MGITGSQMGAGTGMRASCRSRSTMDVRHAFGWRRFITIRGTKRISRQMTRMNSTKRVRGIRRNSRTRKKSDKLTRRKESSMKTFEELKTELTQDLLELEKLAGIWPSTLEKRHLKETEIRPHWYKA